MTHKILEKVFKVNIPKEILSFWEKIEKSEIKDRDFYYKYFGKITPMSPDRISKYSKLAPKEGDRYSYYNQIYALTKAGEISKEQEQEIITASFRDPYVMSIHLNNTLFKKYGQNSYIKYGIPLATSSGSSELIFYGFTESKIADGIFYYNNVFQEYPVFICKTLSEFITQPKEDLSRSEKLREIISNEFCFKINLDDKFEIPVEELKRTFQFVHDSLEQIFEKDISLNILEETIELSFEYRGTTRFLKYLKRDLKTIDALQLLTMSLNNAITEFNKNFKNSYKYTLTEETIQVLHEKEMLTLARLGLIKPYWNNPLPSVAFTSQNFYESKHNDELIRMIKDKGWSKSKIDKFLHDFGETGFGM